MQEIKNPYFKRRIFRNLDKLPEEPKKDFLAIKENFQESYITGGFIRDSILQVVNNYNFPINDLDIMVGDGEYKYKTAKFLETGSPTRFGGIKLKYPGMKFEIDVFQNIYLENGGLEKFLEECDISTSAFAYDLQKDILYEGEAMKDIENEEINIPDRNLLIVPTICRLILHADKMGFSIGNSGLDFIKTKYSPKLDKDIIEFLKYKESSHLLPLIKREIDSMQI
jgi:hypothetical protein